MKILRVMIVFGFVLASEVVAGMSLSVREKNDISKTAPVLGQSGYQQVRQFSTLAPDQEIVNNNASLRSAPQERGLSEKILIHSAGAVTGAAAGLTIGAIGTFGLLECMLYLSESPHGTQDGVVIITMAYAMIGAVAGGLYGGIKAQNIYDYCFFKNIDTEKK